MFWVFYDKRTGVITGDGSGQTAPVIDKDDPIVGMKTFDKWFDRSRSRIHPLSLQLIDCPVIKRDAERADVLRQLQENDLKTFRALRDQALTGKTDSLQAIEDTAAGLRAQLADLPVIKWE